MERTRLAPTVGIVACLVLLGVLVVPYLLIQTPGIAAAYYATTLINPLFAGLFALVTLLALAAGRQRRTDPAIAAAVGLVFGAFAALICLVWTLSGPQEILLNVDLSPGSGSGESPFVQSLQYHPYLVVGLSFVPPLSAGWYASELGLF
ncbi:DUF7548 family protein [Halomarina oriensis]|uniref:Uncharacterized protein n=1 Tax=Halomarina oriensis TaxID=671145 RepID=A0A6B0GLV5_9EURY|nr:hypothetical protein [Halomarina oriensis]MWG35832.1 hypothetical protein [Halomarina oriensis]